MLVKKFEAKSIKKAIEMVKHELGPEAIILSAKEHEKGFGLGGESSVEVTAAISETKLRQKQIAEKKMNQKVKEKYQNISARAQKQYIQSASTQALEMFAPDSQADATPVKVPNAPTQRLITPILYSEILDTEEVVRQPTITSPTIKKATTNSEIESLKNEVSYLKGLLQKFQKMPQGITPSYPGANEGVSYELSFAFAKLIEAGISAPLVADILKLGDENLPLEQKRKRAFVEGWLIKYFLDHVEVTTNPSQGRYHIFMGPTGQGKTTTLVKFATHLILKERKKVAILSGDSSKVGTGIQLKTYAQILNVPFGIIDGEVDWNALDQELKTVDCVLIDTAGSTLKTSSDMDNLKTCLPYFTGANVRKHYVQSIMTRDADAFEVADRFKIFSFDDVIFTRLDEALQFGLIYNFQEKYGCPVHSFGTGASMPEGFEPATKERIVDLVFHLTKVKAERGTP